MKQRNPPNRRRDPRIRIFPSPQLARVELEALQLGEGLAERLTHIVARYDVLWRAMVPEMSRDRWRALESALAEISVTDHAATTATARDVELWLASTGHEDLARRVAGMPQPAVLAVLERVRESRLKQLAPTSEGATKRSERS